MRFKILIFFFFQLRCEAKVSFSAPTLAHRLAPDLARDAVSSSATLLEEKNFELEMRLVFRLLDLKFVNITIHQDRIVM